MSDQSETVNQFDAAKQVAEILGALDKPAQARVLRWVIESLDITISDTESSTRAHPFRPEHAEAKDSEPSTSPHHPPPNKATNVRTFVRDKKPKSDNQYAAVVAYYYQFEAPQDDRQEAITADTLQEAARLAGRQRLNNPKATLNNAAAQGYLDRLGNGQFKINTVGENLVALTLPGDSDSNSETKSSSKNAGTKQSKKSRKKPSKKSGAKSAGTSSKKSRRKSN